MPVAPKRIARIFIIHLSLIELFEIDARCRVVPRRGNENQIALQHRRRNAFCFLPSDPSLIKTLQSS
jgi:hypothetical protein